MSDFELKGFTFYRSYLDAIMGLDQEIKYAVIECIMLFAFYGELPDPKTCDPVVYALFCAFRPNIESSIKKSVNVRDGG